MAQARIGDLKIDRSQEATPGRSGGWAVIVVIILLLAGGGLWFLRIQAKPVVSTALAEAVTGPGGGSALLNATGYVVARRAATVSSKVTGKITEILIEEGMAVDEGQLLARLDQENVRAFLNLTVAQLSASKAATSETAVLVEEAKLELDRVARLSAEEIASKADLDTAKARVDSLKARLDRLRTEVDVAEQQQALREQDLRDLEIRAPFKGVVISKDAQPGEMISPVSAGGGFTRTGICTLVDMESLEIEVDVNESYINRVRANQPVLAVLDAYTDWKIPCTVIAIVPTADRQKATVRVRIRFNTLDPRILPEMGVKVAFQRGASEAENGSQARRVVRISADSLFRDSGRDYVWIVADEVLEKKAVSILERRGSQILLEAGLRGGEAVVINPGPNLKTGQQVSVNEA